MSKNKNKEQLKNKNKEQLDNDLNDSADSSSSDSSSDSSQDDHVRSPTPGMTPGDRRLLRSMLGDEAMYRGLHQQYESEGLADEEEEDEDGGDDGDDEDEDEDAASRYVISSSLLRMFRIVPPLGEHLKPPRYMGDGKWAVYRRPINSQTRKEYREKNAAEEAAARDQVTEPRRVPSMSGFRALPPVTYFSESVIRVVIVLCVAEWSSSVRDSRTSIR